MKSPCAFQALAQGDVDAVVNDGPVSADIIRANPEMKATLVGKPFTDEFYGIAVNKDKPEVLAAINKGLIAVKASGEYDAIYDKWFGTAPAAALGKIKVGTNAEYPPFKSVDASGKIVGFDMDLLDAIAKSQGFEVEFVNTRWDGIFVALASGEFDAVMSAATITEERKQTVDFSDPYFNAGQMMSVKKDSKIATTDDLNGKKVGVQLGTTGDIWVSKNTTAEVVRYDEITLAFQALAQGDVDAVVNDGPVSIDIIKANPEMGVMMVGQPFTDEFYGIAVNKSKADVLAAINKGLAAVKASGEYDTIYNKWFGTK